MDALVSHSKSQLFHPHCSDGRIGTNLVANLGKMFGLAVDPWVKALKGTQFASADRQVRDMVAGRRGTCVWVAGGWWQGMHARPAPPPAPRNPPKALLRPEHAARHKYLLLSLNPATLTTHTCTRDDC